MTPPKHSNPYSSAEGGAVILLSHSLYWVICAVCTRGVNTPVPHSGGWNPQPPSLISAGTPPACSAGPGPKVYILTQQLVPVIVGCAYFICLSLSISHYRRRSEAPSGSPG